MSRKIKIKVRYRDHERNIKLLIFKVQMQEIKNRKKDTRKEVVIGKIKIAE